MTITKKPPGDTAIRIALIGAESTGKSTTAHRIGAALQAQRAGRVEVLPETLRQFCSAMQRPPTRHEQARLITDQLAQEAQAMQRSEVVICDSCPYATAMYSELLFEDTSMTAAAREYQKGYLLTFVTWPEFDWQADPHLGMRDGPQAQQRFHQYLIDALARDHLAYMALYGSPSERTERALAAILALIR
jgi:nicotinamide riboside kinase